MVGTEGAEEAFGIFPVVERDDFSEAVDGFGGGRRGVGGGDGGGELLRG